MMLHQRSLAVAGLALGFAVVMGASIAQDAVGQNPPRTARGDGGAQSVDVQPQEHPLRPVLALGHRMREHFNEIQDYSCVFTKRERLDGKLGEYEEIFMKVRHQPASVYMRFMSPESVSGREAIWVAGQNNGQLLVHGTGFQKKLAGVLSLDPNGSVAMRGSRYPITHAGLRQSNERLLQLAEYETGFGECEVKYFPGAKVDGRACTCIQITHPVPRKNFENHIVRLYIDDKWELPVRTEAYDWPKKPGEQPPLTGEYTYTKLQFNRGLTDLDFDIRNPAYDFK